MPDREFRHQPGRLLATTNRDHGCSLVASGDRF
jgi:hypothetical protein